MLHCRRACCVLFLALPAVQVIAAGPLQTSPDPDPPVRSLSAYSRQRITPQATTGGAVTVPVHILGQTLDVILTPHSVRGDDFRLLASIDRAQPEPAPVPPPNTYQGAVAGRPDALAAASLSNGQVSATIRFEDGTLWHIEPLKALGVQQAAPEDHAVFTTHDVTSDAEYACGVTEPAKPVESGGDIAGTGLKICDLAIDADYEFYQKNGASLPATLADIENIVNRLDIIYRGEVQITYELTTVIVRGSGDNYTGNTPTALLDEFMARWNSSLGDVRRDTAHLFTGKNNGSVIGIAYVGVVCDSGQFNHGYGLSYSKFTNNIVSRTCLTAHEIGHNWNAEHCNGDADCDIMCSGLGNCGGDCQHFGAQSTASILAWRNSHACLTDLADAINPPFADDFPTQTLNGAKWSYADGVDISNAAVGEPSGQYSLRLNALGNGAYQDDEARSNFILLAGDAGSQLRYYTQHRGVESGEALVVEYYASDMRWIELNRVVSTGVDQNTFTPWQHVLPPNALHDKFRLRFRAEVNESNDTWFVDDVLVGLSAPPCPGDLDGDGLIGQADLGILLAAFDTCLGEIGFNPLADLNGDNCVDQADLGTLLAIFGTTCN